MALCLQNSFGHCFSNFCLISVLLVALLPIGLSLLLVLLASSLELAPGSSRSLLWRIKDAILKAVNDGISSSVVDKPQSLIERYGADPETIESALDLVKQTLNAGLNFRLMFRIMLICLFHRQSIFLLGVAH